MKCPKCSYLGFDTGDRCKNCGYDFSFMTDEAPAPPEIDLDLRTPGIEGGTPAFPDPMLREPEPAAPMEPVAGSVPREPKLPLFTPALDDGGDEPLIKLPPAPRPPLAVRRTPDTPRLRAIAQSRVVEPEPVLKFEEEEPVRPVSRVWAEPGDARAEASGSGARLAAAVIDHLLLAGIDLAVVYFTLRMAGMPMSEWTALPPVPLIAFLLLVKLSYFCAFTAVGGQTIGKMAAHIRVVTTDERPLDAALALRRTLAGAASAGLLGLGFLPALVTGDRRALHDRMARTRVIAIPSA